MTAAHKFPKGTVSFDLTTSDAHLERDPGEDFTGTILVNIDAPACCEPS
jgi:hypothetical protein